MSVTKLYTAEDLLTLDTEGPTELIEGVLVDVPPSEFDSSEIAVHIAAPLHEYVYPRGLGRLSGEGGGYVLRRDPDTVLAPDVGFIASDSPANQRGTGKFASVAPDLAVEVMSPSDRFAELERKAQRYLDAGTRLVWVVRPDCKTVTVFALGREPTTLSIDDVLDGEEVVPGFRLSVRDVFR